MRNIFLSDEFFDIYNRVRECIEDMNPDSLIKVLSAFELLDLSQPELIFYDLYTKIMDWLAMDDNVTLFSPQQLATLFNKCALLKNYTNRCAHREKIIKIIMKRTAKSLAELSPHAIA